MESLLDLRNLLPRVMVKYSQWNIIMMICRNIILLNFVFNNNKQISLSIFAHELINSGIHQADEWLFNIAMLLCYVSQSH